MMNNPLSSRVYFVLGYTDMRKSINGLSLIVSEILLLNPMDSSYFVFCNRHRNRLKILVWDGNGFWLYYKRLEKGHFQWPQSRSEKTLCLSHQELSWLLAGLAIVQPNAHKALHTIYTG